MSVKEDYKRFLEQTGQGERAKSPEFDRAVNDMKQRGATSKRRVFVPLCQRLPEEK